MNSRVSMLKTNVNLFQGKEKRLPISECFQVAFQQWQRAYYNDFIYEMNHCPRFTVSVERLVERD